ncbi:MAG TPA: hypothetical protein VEV62_19655 [Parafilimonas sp.]|nr:hypothetical protein [Parafilimonas sp.]
MRKLNIKSQKIIFYSLAVVAIIAGCIVPDKLFEKDFFFGLAGGILIVSFLNYKKKLSTKSTVEGSDTTKLN